MPRLQMDPRISFGNILTALSMIGTVVLAYSSLKAEVANVDRRVATLECSLAASGMIATTTPCTLPYRIKVER